MLSKTKTIAGTLVTGALLLGTLGTGVVPGATASAAPASSGSCSLGDLCLFQNSDYGGSSWSTSHVGTTTVPSYMKDKASSVLNFTGCIGVLEAGNGSGLLWMQANQFSWPLIPGSAIDRTVKVNVTCTTYSLSPRRNSVSNLRPKLIRS
jgi:hypothetical protein